MVGLTGRRLYDKFCDSAADQGLLFHYGTSVLPHEKEGAIAWPFLSPRDQRVWNDLALRLTPRPRKRA